MGWMQKLYETYEQCEGKTVEAGSELWPLSHIVKKVHVEVVIDANGIFRRCHLLGRSDSPTLIPATESSAGRTRGIAAHPLCEEIGYCALDYPESDSKKYEEYEKLLSNWCASEYSHPKIKSVFAYVKKGRIWSDLSKEGIFPVKVEDAQGKKTKIEDKKVFLRWRVEEPHNPCSGVWEDKELINAWIKFDKTQNIKKGFCMLTGEPDRLAQNHSRFIRFSSDGAKLISANDFAGYTFKGRFTDEKNDYENQPCSVGFEVSQKAHNALRWLIHRQGYRNGDQVIVTWAVAGKPLPDPFQDSLHLILGIEEKTPTETPEQPADPGDVGQSYALRLNRAIKGYRAQLAPDDDIIIMGLDAATPGRMAIIFYRELKGSEFLDRVQTWHSQYAWPQNFGKDSHFVGAPAPRDIAEAAYGRRLDDKLRKAAVERLLPCIIDSLPIPVDLMQSTIRHACNRVGLEHWEWEKCLGIACALYKGYSSSQQKEYSMALEQNRTTRDYLYGRLLAIADNIEQYALKNAGQVRDTTAAKLMQRFADRPFSTWRNIELALTPYKSQLRASEKGAGFLYNRDKLLDEVQCAFHSEEFINDTSLTGEFLLGYHCQRQELLKKHEKSDSPNNDENSEPLEE